MSVYDHDRQPLGNRLSDSPRRTARRPRRGLRATAHRPRLELLESRVVLSPTIFTVDSTGSGTSGSGMSGTLPYVISQADSNSNADGSEIEFDSSVFSSQQTITLGATLVLSETVGPEMIDGPGSGLVTISGGGAVSVFEVSNGVTASLSGLTISDGSTAGNGGGLYNDGGTITLTNVTVSGNSAGNSGGGVENLGMMTVSNSAFSSDTAGLVGGGIRNDGGGIGSLTNCTFSQDVGGSEFGGGGGLANYAIMMVNGCTFSGNSGPYGSGLYNAGATSLTVDDSTFSDNSASVFGGGIDNEGGPLTVDGSTFSGNSASQNGGGLDDVYGGSVIVDGCTFSGNSATAGAGLYVGAGSTATLTNVTVSGNSAGEGGGLCDNGTTALTNCTVTGNSAVAGGGLYSSGSPTATLTNTIVAGNTDFSGNPSDIGGAQASQATGSYNLIGTGGSGGITAGSDGNIVLTSLVNLGLAPLGDYGGPTETIALLSGSAAIGAGTTTSGVASDQRGFALDATPDIGAFQTQPALVVNTTIDGTGSALGDLSLRQAVNLADALDAADTITFDPIVFATPQTITLVATLPLSATAGPVVIDGPGAGLVTISGNNTNAVFNIAVDTVVSMSGLSISDGIGTFGGGVFNGGTLTITNTTFTGNSAAYGGAIYTRALGDDPLTGVLTLIGDTFSNNSATAESGALDNWAGGIVTVTNDTFTENSAPNGGAIGNEWGSVAVSNSTFSNNTASTGAGGAIINFNPSDSFSNSLSVVGSTISGNTAVNGGGIANGGPDSLSLTNDTITGNSVTGDGGGLYNYGTAMLTACTVSGNSAGAGGGLYNIGASAVATLTDTIIAANVEPGGAPDDLNGSAAGSVTGSFNLIGIGGSGGITGASDGNIVLTSLADLGLAPLGDYGGPTETMALLPGSAAIGAGTATSGITADQRGAPLPTSRAVDIGAFQDQGYTVAVSSGSPQSTLVSQPFSAPLVALLTENFASAPLPGATIEFSAPSSGASATLSANSAVTDASGVASVTATANPTAVHLSSLTASATGESSPALYNLTNLTNQIQPNFSGLTEQTATYGSTVTALHGYARGWFTCPDRGRCRHHDRWRHTRRQDRFRRFVFDEIYRCERGAERELDGLQRQLRICDGWRIPRGRGLEPTDSQPGAARDLRRQR